MTRTERSVFPRAMLKDRSESRSGLDKSLRKNGAGPHNWGSLDDERELEYAAMDDEGIEAEEADDDSAKSVTSDVSDHKKPETTVVATEEDIETARQFRKNAFKGEVDLSAIARTSAAVSSSPPHTVAITSDANTAI